MVTPGEPGEKQSFLKPAVAAADHHDVPPLVEGAIARGAEVDTSADEVLFSWHTQAPVGGAGGQNDGGGAVLLAGLDLYRPVVAVLLQRSDILGSQNLHVEALGLLPEALGQLGAADGLGEAGVVLYLLGDARLAPYAGPFDYEGAQPLSGRVDARRQSAGAASDDHQVVVASGRLAFDSQLLGQLGVAGFD